MRGSATAERKRCERTCSPLRADDHSADDHRQSAHDRATTPTGHAHARAKTASHAHVRARKRQTL
jgi:hypothetical protein